MSRLRNSIQQQLQRDRELRRAIREDARSDRGTALDYQNVRMSWFGGSAILGLAGVITESFLGGGMLGLLLVPSALMLGTSFFGGRLYFLGRLRGGRTQLRSAGAAEVESSASSR